MPRPRLALLAVPLLLAAAPVPKDDNRAAREAIKEAAAALDGANGDILARTRLWCSVAELYRKLGDREEAAESLRKAKAVTEEGRRERVEEWRAIGLGYGRLGNAKAVLDLAAATPQKVANRRDNPRETILQEAARAAAKAGENRAVEQIADAIPDEDARKRVRAEFPLLAIAHRARTGDVAGAVRAAGELPTAAEKVFALVGRSDGLAFDDHHALDGVAPVQLAAGDKAGAKETALKTLALLPDVEANRRGAAAGEVVRMLARLDDMPAARKVLAQIPAADPKAKGRGRFTDLAKCYLAAAEVRAGNDAAAEALAGDFTESGFRAWVLHFVALAQARAGRKDAAKANFAKAIELVTANGPGTSLHNIASAQALAGDADGRRKTAEAAGGIAWVNVAHAQAEAGDFAGALATAAAGARPGDWWNAEVTRDIARQQARAGQAAAVRERVGKEENRLVRAYALLGLAEGLYREPAKGRAGR